MNHSERVGRPADEQAAEAAVRLHAAAELAEHVAFLGTVHDIERAELRDQALELADQAKTLLETRSRLRVVA